MSPARRRIHLPDGHPLAHIRTLTLHPVIGRAEITTNDGSVITGRVDTDTDSTAIISQTFEVQTSTLHFTLNDGSIFTSHIGIENERPEVPVVYLDQNHWIDVARVLTRHPSIGGEQKNALVQLIDLARADDIILPLSGAHLVETAKKGGRQRTDLARAMIELSRGWQMRSPLAVRAFELRSLFATSGETSRAETNTGLDVFTLTPEALWADRYTASTAIPLPDDLPNEVAGLIDRIRWTASITDVLLDTDPEVSQRGVAAATAWAESFHELAVHMRDNPHAQPFRRDLTRTRLITDMGDDVSQAAMQAGLTPEQFRSWLQHDAESALSSTPALGRIRELVHLRLLNAQDPWHFHDLNDVLFLGTAAGYADVVLVEKKTCSYLRRVEGRVPPGARVHRRAVEALPDIVAAVGTSTRLT